VSHEIYSADTQPFIWKEIDGKDVSRCTQFLRQRFDLQWISDANIEKSNNEIKLSSLDHSLSVKIESNDNNSYAIVTLDNNILPLQFSVNNIDEPTLSVPVIMRIKLY
jgi:hypothetical protein